MSKNYYYLIAGLPDISMDDSKPVCPMATFRTEYYPELTADDRALTDLLWLEQDNRNLLALLADKGAELDCEGLYTADELREVIRMAREDEKWDARYPRYLRDFIRAYDAEETEREMPSDLLSSYYYRHAMDADNEFVSRWFAFNLDMNNILSAMTARKHRLNVASVVVGDGEVAEALRTNSSRDFGLAGSFDRLDVIQQIHDTANLVEREHRIDALRWSWLDDESFFDYFGIEKLFGFLVKNRIVERWARLDKEIGGGVLRSMITRMKDVNIPAEFRL
ncbi:MAG: DUF2764 family protein [Bacteroidaceae bacterium]|nr:DUF2764 family protein [Bacteroidaceae bacterium]